MTLRVDISRAECGRLATALQGATLFQSYDDALAENNEAAALILTLRDALDAAEKERDEARKERAHQQGRADANARKTAEEQRRADAEYARGVRDAAKLFRDGAKVRRDPPDMGGLGDEVAACDWDDYAECVLALLPADVKETNDGH